jgi:hypothetical protein
MSFGAHAGRWIDGLERAWMARRRRDRDDATRSVDAAGARLRVRVTVRPSPPHGRTSSRT